ncbi:trimethylamine methyltransferase family protein [Dethiobacter alkaliphilus]|uniref:trimethylamine methyltransferase family protein n=1 Tax=Dethiobacter alkaliphilus TaxID=427926 RepID=UPI0022275142|nr:trimethylamine methyltransferase family protein [Dethiobacter alkaliphilus]MCW3490973.1 trimethylamine methyltransferase family protein [Dethiobacter alkaliphilus]
MDVIFAGFESGYYRPLSDTDIEKIHETTVSILQDPGVKVTNPEALQLFHDKGAHVDFAEKTVRIPRSMLEDAIASAPSRVILYGREEKNNLLLEGKRTYMGTGGTVLTVLDMDSGERRKAGIRDLIDLARLADQLDNVHFFMLPVFPAEADGDNVDVNRFWWALQNTTKHVMGGVYTVDGIRNVIQIAEDIAGGKDALRAEPFISMVTCVMSPLVLENTYTGLLMEVARQGIPLVCPAEPLAGATGPCTLAGTVAISNAETLSGIVLAQLVNPGTPVIYGTVSTTMDMQTGSYLSGNVEMGLINCACTQMAQYYRIPIYATAGMSDSKLPDAQAGYEKMATAMMTALAGANFVHDAAGFLEFCTTISYEQMVIDNEIIGMCMRAAKGVEVSEKTLAEEVIRKVGTGGNYLAHPHTLQNFRSEFYLPTLSDRKTRKQWDNNGAQDTVQRAREKARFLLQQQTGSKVPEDLLLKIKSRYADLGIIEPVKI